MICYRDRTFCSNPGCPPEENCSRRLTDEEAARAVQMDLPIARMACPRNPIPPEADTDD